MSAQLSVERQGEVALFQLGDNGDFPRLSLSLLGELERALIEAGRDAKVRAIVIAGSQRPRNASLPFPGRKRYAPFRPPAAP